MNIEIYTNILTCICICSHISIYIWNMHGRCHSALAWWLTQKQVVLILGFASLTSRGMTGRCCYSGASKIKYYHCYLQALLGVYHHGSIYMYIHNPKIFTVREFNCGWMTISGFEGWSCMLLYISPRYLGKPKNMFFDFMLR